MKRTPKKEKLRQRLEAAAARTQISDLTHVIQLDAELSKAALELLPIARQKAKRSEYTLLRILIGYSQKANRRLAAEARIRATAAKTK